MRKIANVPGLNVNEIVRVMLYELGDGTGTYLFLYMSARDGPCDFDEFYETVAEAEQSCAVESLALTVRCGRSSKILTLAA